MKKSEIFRKTQYAVVDSENLLMSEKTEILETLMREEYINRVCEKQEEKESEDKTSGEL